MKRLIIDLDTSWVLSQRDARQLPASAIAESLEACGVSVLDQTFTKLTVEFQDETISFDQLRTLIVGQLVTKFSVTEAELENLLQFQLDNAAPPEPEKAPQPEPKKEEKAPAKEPAPAKPQPAKPEPAEAQPAPTAMEEIRRLLGAEQFIGLCEEIYAMAPLLKKHDLPRILTNRSYLFSVDEGGGLTTALELLAKLLQEQGLFPAKGNCVTEMKLDGETPQKDPLKEAASMLSHAQNKVICLDISLWMDKVASPAFRDFLVQLQKNGDKVIYVFRVPYLEQEALSRIAVAISDVMLLQTVSFVPLTNDQLQKIACGALEQYGFTAAPEAWDLFQQRLAEEKSDGRFYGINTAKKIVDEMIYQKLHTILSGGEENTAITGQDVRGLAHNVGGQIPASQQMDRMVGIDAIRKRLEEIVGQIVYARKNQGVQAPAMHMRFVGAPGTGKTTVARIVGQMLKERGILSHGYFFEHSGGDFLGMYVGHTAPKTLALCRDAYGSVLFIDEAYTLADASYSNGDGFAKEAIDTLIAQMENHREDMVVIMAGYPKEMDQLMELNPGLAGRMPYELVFPNYTREELAEIYLRMADSSGFRCAEGFDQVVRDYFLGLEEQVVSAPDFSNARFVRNLFERTWSKTVMRTQLDGSDPRTITAEDFQAATTEDAKALGLKQVKKSRPGYRLGLV